MSNIGLLYKSRTKPIAVAHLFPTHLFWMDEGWYEMPMFAPCEKMPRAQRPAKEHIIEIVSGAFVWVEALTSMQLKLHVVTVMVTGMDTSRLGFPPRKGCHDHVTVNVASRQA